MRRITYWKSLPLTYIGMSYSVIPTQTVNETNLHQPEDFDKIVAEVKTLGCMYEVVKLHEPTLLEADNAHGKFPR